ncbi:probable LRR receptor-like serine/threonine-protein kinase At1g56140 [Selaginella moellendorffii]|uniref:probable LRR receptor-like serine/threonine-protein kinase At1g56140 n=1 Tax=Selaginella moellendorffii TaxID=88036 RepID=UPI000D1CDFA2|nr:probable LRR receptor-like serine/threonine-protein kinase At1g56140 [Selaginella moellendorffii]|eukprot:XP_024522486.1 probable LRR receptor-like serine/threonine-protein kinase At1g56140 [Selaginella moellendorffii]
MNPSFPDAQLGITRIVILFILIQAFLAAGKLLMHAQDDDFPLTNAASNKLHARFLSLITAIPPKLTYDGATDLYFRGQVIADTLFLLESNFSLVLNLCFYNVEYCGPNFSPDFGGTGSKLRAGFTALLPDLRGLMNLSYGAAYVAQGQFQAGYYIKGMNLRGSNGSCSSLRVENSTDHIGYCYDYEDTRLSYSAFDRLYPGYRIQSAKKPEYVLEMREDCNAVFSDTTTKEVLWQSKTKGSGRDCELVLEKTATLAVYDRNGTVLARFGTNNSTNASLFAVQGDRNMVIYAISNMKTPMAVWSSHTFQDPSSPNGSTPQPNGTSSVSQPSLSSKSRRGIRTIAVSLGASLVGVALVILCVVLILRKKRNRKASREALSWLPPDSKARKYSYKELQEATKGFHKDNLVGRGGFASVYKGVIDNHFVAVKYLTSSDLSDKARRDFENEVSTICLLQHKNVVKLFGFCSEKEHKLTVCEFIENGNLSDALFRSPDKGLELNWTARYNICVGVAQGLAYLHGETSQATIVHRDIKALSILLASNLEAKISDFGLARLIQEDRSYINTRATGTVGYLAPEYALSGQLTEKADVYSFEILVLEILSGRISMDFTLSDGDSFLLERAWNVFQSGHLLEMIDKRLDVGDERDIHKMERVFLVALHCTQASGSRRSSMFRVVGMLMGDMEIGGTISRPGFLFDLRQNLEQSKSLTKT